MQRARNYLKEDKQAQNMNKSTQNQPPSDSKGQLNQYIKQDQMIKILNKKGIKKLFPIQYETFNLIYKQEDVIAKDRTGSGKTLAFALPIIMRMRDKSKFKGSHNPKFLIVLPTRQLAIQVKEEISSLRLRDQEDFNVTAIYGGTSIQEQLDIIGKGIDIIVGTPGRLIDLMNRGAIKLADLQCVCLDEADEMLKIGFKEDIQKIFQFIKSSKTAKVQCLLFSATIPDWIWQISNLYQSKTKKFIDMIKDNNIRTSKTVQHYCIKASHMEKQAYMGSIIKHFLKGKNGKVIIFCQTKRQVQRISSSELIPLSLQKLHGDVKQFQRQKVFRKFKSGQIDCLIATNVAARGLDFPEIDLIIQMQPPNTTDTYIHRSGRTGRAGKSGICVTLYSPKQEHLMRRIQSQTKIILHQMNSRQLKPLSPNQRQSYKRQQQRDTRHSQNDRNRDDKYNDRDRNDKYRNDRSGNDYSKQRKYERDQSNYKSDRLQKSQSKPKAIYQQKKQQVDDLEY